MPVVDMLCLANSRKYGGRCVAGILNDGSWIRPVSDSDDGSLPESACQLDVGRAVRPLDVVELAVAAADPRPHQPENWIVADETWKLARTRDLADIADFLDRRVYGEPLLFGTLATTVVWERILDGDLDHSLALLRISRPLYRWSDRDPTQLRAEFEYRGNSYDLPLTFEEVPPAGRSPADWFLTISLGEPFARQRNNCYKLIAGAIEITGSGKLWSSAERYC